MIVLHTDKKKDDKDNKLKMKCMALFYEDDWAGAWICSWPRRPSKRPTGTCWPPPLLAPPPPASSLASYLELTCLAAQLTLFW